MCEGGFFGGGNQTDTDPLPVAPTSNDAAVGEAETKRKRASAAAFGREATIATSGSGVTGAANIAKKIGN